MLDLQNMPKVDQKRVQKRSKNRSKIDRKSIKKAMPFQPHYFQCLRVYTRGFYKPVSAQEREARSIKITFAQVLHSNTGNDSRAHANQSKQTQDSFEMVRELASHLESVKNNMVSLPYHFEMVQSPGFESSAFGLLPLEHKDSFKTAEHNT